MKPLEYIRSKGLEHRIQSNQIILQICPFCGDPKGHFYMDQTEGTFYCHKCNERGNLITLQKHYGDFPEQPRPRQTFQKPQGNVSAAFSRDKNFALPDEKSAIDACTRLLNDPEALSYVTEKRGLSLETIKAFKLGLEIDKVGERWLSIPHYENGRLQNIKFRCLPPTEKAFKRVKDCRSVLFNGDIVKQSADELFLCEGEIDCMTLWNHGIKNAIATTTGAGSFDAEWVDQLRDVVRIVLVYDADEAGKKGAREVARRLGYDRCLNLQLPEGHDINSFFCQESEAAAKFLELIETARPFDVEGVSSFVDVLEQYRLELENPSQTTGIRTGFSDLDRIIKTGMMPGELIVLSAPPKIGKSTLALQVCTYNAFQGLASLFFCLEMPKMKIVKKIAQCHTRRPEISGIELDQTRKAFIDKPLYLGACHTKPVLDGIMQTLKASIRRYGLKLVVFDHLHFLCRSVSNQTQEIGLAVQAFKFLAEELEIPVILIAQPRKIQDGAVMTAMDLKDSSSIYSDCDHLIIMHRARKASNGKTDAPLQEAAFEPVAMIRVEASRYNAGGECLLFYHGEYSRFDAMASNNLK